MSSNMENFGRGQNKKAFVLIFLGLLILVINIVFALWYGGNDQKAISRLTRAQVLSQKISNFANGSVTGREEAFKELRSTRNEIDGIVNDLLNGSKDGMRSLKGGGDVGKKIDALAKTWTPIKNWADSIIKQQELVLDITQTAASFQTTLPKLTYGMDEVVTILRDRDAPGSQVYLATRQMLLADRMLRRVSELLKGGPEAITAADQFSRDARQYDQVLSGLIDGNAEMNIRALTDADARARLDTVKTQYDTIGAEVEKIQEASSDLQDVTTASNEIFDASGDLLKAADEAAKVVEQLPEKRIFPRAWWYGVGLLLLVAGLYFITSASSKDANDRARVNADLNQRNQEAILRLLDEMGSLAEGDLTVKATVTEDITGAIADSINFAVEALRNLVGTINETAVQVAAAAQETQATAMHLAEAAEHQAQQITSASAAINEIAVSIDEVSKNSAESADVAQRSVQIASKGAAMVRQTIQGMDSIRDQIQETAKRIKRLGESSQEIGSIVELINDIADQTNILALNAAIQAAAAGDAGRGFAVVADEVQRLAERSAGATKRIETLVQTIQSDTNEAVSSMEQTTAEVVAGARLAEDAGLALGEIEKVSADLSDLIQNISEAARQQSAAATNISATMNVIQEITAQTSAGASQTAESIGNLAQLAADLRRSVADFKLPT